MTEKMTYDELLDKVSHLEESERNFRTMVEGSPDILYRADLEGRVVYISKSVYSFTDYTTEEAIGMKLAEEVYLDPEERKRFIKELQKNGKVQNFEVQMKRKDGSVWWASTNAHFYTDNEGNIIGVEGVTRDITELKSAEEKLARYRDHLEELVEERTTELKHANDNIKVLSGLIPICASCKKIRDDKGFWNQIESYIQQHSEAEFSHGVCPECSDKLYGDQDWYIKMKEKKGYDH